MITSLIWELVALAILAIFWWLFTQIKRVPEMAGLVIKAIFLIIALVIVVRILLHILNFA